MINKLFILFTIFTIFTIFSCNKNKTDKLCPNYSIDSKTYQCHNLNAKNFSFLSKYKNLEVLDLTGTNIKDISFLKDLEKLKILILDSESINKKNIMKESLKYKDVEFINSNKGIPNILKNYIDFSFSFFRKDIYSVNYFLYPFFSIPNDEIICTYINEHEYYDDSNNVDILCEGNHKFSDLKGITQLYNLRNLKIALRSDKDIKYITKLKYLENLSLIGEINKLPVFQKSLKSLYLYNTQVKDFSFLKKSNIDYLYITTKDYTNKYWDKLKREYPDIDIHIVNNFFLPVKRYKNHALPKKIEYNFISHIQFDGFYLDINKRVVNELRENNLLINLTLRNIKFMVNELGIKVNHIWNNDITFLDRALGNQKKDIVEYLKNNKAKRGCEILNKECKKPKKINIKAYYPISFKGFTGNDKDGFGSYKNK